jgi:hypothetical protein
MLPFYLVFAAVLYPPSAAGQSRAFAVESEVAIHADSFACKETSELDRLSTQSKRQLRVRNTTVRLSKAHKCVGLTAGRARVYSTRGQYVCIYDLKDNKMGVYPCALD